MTDTDGLFGAQGLPAKPQHGGAREGAGRKPMTPNRFNLDIALYLRKRAYETHGREPIELDMELANRDMARDLEELKAFAAHLGCSRLDAFREWRAIKRELYPKIYQSLTSVEIKPPGAPGSGELAPVDGDLPEQLVRGPDGVYRAADDVK